MNVERLLELARILRLPMREGYWFNGLTFYSRWVNAISVCGLGYAATHPPFQKAGLTVREGTVVYENGSWDPPVYFKAASAFFDVSLDVALDFFDVSRYAGLFAKEDIALRIEEAVKEHGQRQTIGGRQD